jgi:hypothetical protein
VVKELQAKLTNTERMWAQEKEVITNLIRASPRLEALDAFEGLVALVALVALAGLLGLVGLVARV